jgi:hypothetical protein
LHLACFHENRGIASQPVGSVDGIKRPNIGRWSVLSMRWTTRISGLNPQVRPCKGRVPSNSRCTFVGDELDRLWKRALDLSLMKIQIDTKSALFGLVAGVLTMFAIGAGTTSTGSGRYQVSAGQNCAVMIDTITGKAWSLGVAGTTSYPPGDKCSNFWDDKTAN